MAAYHVPSYPNAIEARRQRVRRSCLSEQAGFSAAQRALQRRSAPLSRRLRARAARGPLGAPGRGAGSAVAWQRLRRDPGPVVRGLWRAAARGKLAPTLLYPSPRLRRLQNRGGCPRTGRHRGAARRSLPARRGRALQSRGRGKAQPDFPRHAQQPHRHWSGRKAPSRGFWPSTPTSSPSSTRPISPITTRPAAAIWRWRIRTVSAWARSPRSAWPVCAWAISWAGPRSSPRWRRCVHRTISRRWRSARRW